MGAIAMQYNASAHGTNNHRSTTRLPPTAPMKLSWALLRQAGRILVKTLYQYSAGLSVYFHGRCPTWMSKMWRRVLSFRHRTGIGLTDGRTERQTDRQTDGRAVRQNWSSNVALCMHAGARYKVWISTSCARGDLPPPLQADNIFAFIRQVAPVPVCWLFKTSATSLPLTFWPWKWCSSHVWRGLPLCQF